MISENDKTEANDLSTWVFAVRPKTLTGTTVPVVIGITWTWKLGGGESFRVIPVTLRFLFAFLMQIDSNPINDYFGCLKGNDNRTIRLGLKWACSKGWIALPATRIGLAITLLLTSLTGTPLIFHDGREIVLIGVTCVLFTFLYIIYFLYLDLGGASVLVFFGIIPVVSTAYVILPDHSQVPYFKVIVSEIICGLMIDTLLVVNSRCDREDGRHDGKITLIMRVGGKKAEKLYLVLGLIICPQMLLLLLSGERDNPLPFIFVFIIFMFYGILHYETAVQMKLVKKGKELDVILAQIARSMLIYGIATMVALVGL